MNKLLTSTTLFILFLAFIGACDLKSQNRKSEIYRAPAKSEESFDIQANFLLDHENTILDILKSKSELETRLDKLFYSYSQCFIHDGNKALNWKIIKSIAYAESGLNIDSNVCDKRTKRYRANVPQEEPLFSKYRAGRKCRKNRKYIGLFQEDERFCKKNFVRYACSGCSRQRSRRISLPDTYNLNCKIRRHDADINTLSAVRSLGRSARFVHRYCPNSNVEDFISLLYVGHNDGPGVLSYVLGRHRKGPKRAACHSRAIVRRLDHYYRSGLSRLGHNQGMRKFRYGRNKILPFAKKLKTRNKFMDQAPKACALNMQRPLWPLLRQ